MLTCDAETDPFLHSRIPQPFIWGLYDGKKFRTFNSTEEFVNAVSVMDIVLYAHNGGKFDFMYLLPFIRQTKAQIINGRIVAMWLGRCELRDSFAIIPEPLRNFGDKREIDYNKLEASIRDLFMDEIKEYLFYDCKILFDACFQYRKAVGHKKTIASNALAFSKKLGLNPGKSSARFDKQFRDFYFGGRTECFQPGTHTNIKILDIKSAYPFAMSHDHANGNQLSDYDRVGSLEGMTEDEIARSFIKIECQSFGAFPKRSNGPIGGLYFPHEYDEYNITGWEYLAAKEFGLFDNEKILSVRHCRKTINFSDYVQHWYKKKAAISKKLDPIGYTIAKIMMNSLYGKLAQNPAKYYDYKIMPAGSRACDFEPSRKDTTVCSLCGEKDSEHGWEHATDFGNLELHRRASLYKHKLRYGAEWEARSLYNNVATGASITGFTRAHLLRAMCMVGRHNVIYCDTDSIICRDGTDISALAISDKLGDWELEDACAPIGHFAGKKLYGIKTSQFDKAGKPVFKIASKGSKLDYEQLERIVNGETIEWKSPAPSFSITSGKTPFYNTVKDFDSHSQGQNVDTSKLFVVRNIRKTAIVRD